MATEMRRTGGVQEQDVWAAADALLLEGDRPTIERVRQKIGRGSPNTVSPYLDRWFASLGARIKDPAAFAPAVGVPDPIQQAAKHFWEVASAAARAEISAQYQERLAEVDRREAEVAQERQALTEREAGLHRALDEATERARLLADSNARLRATLEERDTELAGTRTELASERASRASLEERLHTDRQRFDSERRALEERADAERRRAAQEVDRAREAQKELRSNIGQLEQSLATLREQHATETKAAVLQADALRFERDGLQQQAAVLHAKAEAAEQERRRAAERADELLRRVDALHLQLQVTLQELRDRDDARTALLKSIEASTKKRESHKKKTVPTTSN